MDFQCIFWWNFLFSSLLSMNNLQLFPSVRVAALPFPEVSSKCTHVNWMNERVPSERTNEGEYTRKLGPSNLSNCLELFTTNCHFSSNNPSPPLPMLPELMVREHFPFFFLFLFHSYSSSSSSSSFFPRKNVTK